MNDTNDKHDPAPAPTALPRERIMSVVNGVSSIALDELRDLREQCDEVMRALTERQETIAHDIEEFSQMVEGALHAKEIIAENLKRLQQQFQRAPVPKTVAQMPKVAEIGNSKNAPNGI